MRWQWRADRGATGIKPGIYTGDGYSVKTNISIEGTFGEVECAQTCAGHYVVLLEN